MDKKVVKCIENWLPERKQQVFVQGEKQIYYAGESGAPERTFLGPALFSMYINDFKAEVKDINMNVPIIKFADDTVVKEFKRIQDRDRLLEALNCLSE